MKSPAHHEDIARGHEAAGEWRLAARAWFMAKGASVGHMRRDRYEAHMDRCEARVDVEEWEVDA